MKQNKRLSVSLSKEDLRKIDSLADEFGESKASIVQQAVRLYYYLHYLSKEASDGIARLVEST